MCNKTWSISPNRENVFPLFKNCRMSQNTYCITPQRGSCKLVDAFLVTEAENSVSRGRLYHSCFISGTSSVSNVLEPTILIQISSDFLHTLQINSGIV